MRNELIMIALLVYTLQLGTTARPMLVSMTRMGVKGRGPFHVIGVFLLLPIAGLFTALGVAFAKIGELFAIAGIGDSAYGRFAVAELRKELGADQDVVISHANGYATVNMSDIGDKLAALPNRNYNGTLGMTFTNR